MEDEIGHPWCPDNLWSNNNMMIEELDAQNTTSTQLLL